MTTALKYQNRDEWHKIRSRGIGGSDVSAILGFNPWRSPVEVWEEKTGRAESKDNESNVCFVGSWLEECAAQLYTKETGRRVQKFEYTLSDGVFQGNVDRLVIPDGEESAAVEDKITTPILLECKTTSEWKWDEVPLYYQAQVQHYMGLIPDSTACDVAVIYKPNTGFEVFRIQRDDSVISSMRAYLKEWWNEHVIKGIPPEPRNEADCRILWQKSRNADTFATPEILRTVEKLKFCRDEISALKKEEEIQKSKLAVFMGSCDTLKDPDTEQSILTYRTSRGRQVIDYPGIVKELQARLGMSNDEIETLTNIFTTEAQGFRSFNFPKMRKD